MSEPIFYCYICNLVVTEDYISSPNGKLSRGECFDPSCGRYFHDECTTYNGWKCNKCGGDILDDSMCDDCAVRDYYYDLFVKQLCIDCQAEDMYSDLEFTIPPKSSPV